MSKPMEAASSKWAQHGTGVRLAVANYRSVFALILYLSPYRSRRKQTQRQRWTQ